jgi:peptide/nickel transport system substrate-binding protein
MPLSPLLRVALATAALSWGVGHACAQTVAPDRILRVVPFADLATLDPITTTAGNVQSHAFMVYDFLFGRDAKQVPRPQMVDTWSTSADGLVWRFTLRAGLAFHDGAPVTSEDVIASLKRWGARDAHGRLLIAATETMTAVDAATLEIKLKAPFGMMLEALSKSGSNVPAIMPKRIADSDATKPITDPTGSGPFIFVREEWKPGAKAVYVRNTKYVPRAEPADGSAGGKVAHLDRVEWLTLGDPQAAVLALQAGEIDFMENTPVDLIPELKQKGLGLTVTNTFGFQGMARLNHLHAPFNDPKARQALLYLIEQPRYLRAMWGDQDNWKPCFAYLTCGSAFGSEAGVEPEFGRAREKAKQLLAEAGYKGEPIVILQPTDLTFLANAGLLLAQDLRAIGATVELRSMDFTSVAQRRTNKAPPAEGGWHVFFSWWNGATQADPVGNVPLAATCDRAWPGWPCDAAHQGLIDAFPAITDPAAQRAQGEKIQRSALTLVPYLPLGMWTQPVAHNPKLRDLLAVPGVMTFWNVKKGL